MSDKLFAHKDCPTAGTGCHAWLFYMAHKMKDHGIADEVAVPYITARMSRPPAPAEEVEHALAAAKGEKPKSSPRWPSKSFEKIQMIFKTAKVPDWKPTGIDAEDAIDTLFPGNPLLCVGQSAGIFTTRPRELLRGSLAKQALIVPSPMSALLGYSQAAKRELEAGKKFVRKSAHTLDNTGDRQYIITEWDWGTSENHLRLIRHLAIIAPLAAVVLSGGKSTHAWWDCRGVTEDVVKEFFTSAVELGADPRLWLKSQFCRMPGGTRDNGKRQEILYLRK